MRTTAHRADPETDLGELIARLRDEIATLTPAARRTVDALSHGSIEWDRQRARLDLIAYHVAEADATEHARYHLTQDAAWLRDRQTPRG